MIVGNLRVASVTSFKSLPSNSKDSKDESGFLVMVGGSTVATRRQFQWDDQTTSAIRQPESQCSKRMVNQNDANRDRMNMDECY